MSFGLSSDEVKQIKEKYGDNKLPEEKPVTFFEVFKEQFEDPMLRILIAIAVIYIVMFIFGYAKIYEPIGTMIAVLLVSFFNAKTEVSNDKKYRSLKSRIKKDECKVYRDGSIVSIPIDDIVIGDAVLLQTGDKVPADGVLVDGSILVNNAVLNGENDDIHKEYVRNGELPDNVTAETLVDKHSLFRGTVVTDGEGILDVQRVGLETMMGKMAEEMQAKEPDSPLKVKLNKLANQISVFGYVGAVVITLLHLVYFVVSAGGVSSYFATGAVNIFQDVLNAISLAIVIVVCAVPEGLPLMISLVLMQNTSKMLDHNVLVRKSIGIETAGSLNILFSDKTGTITKGELEVVEMFTADGKKLDSLTDKMKKSICKNTQAMFDKEGNILGGNATDKALLKTIGKGEYLKVGKSVDGDKHQDFNSSNKFSQTYVKAEKRTYYTGAPERLCDKAVGYLNSVGEVETLDKGVLNQKIDELASRSMRVLAFGFSASDMTENKVNDDIIITGLVGIRDDVRPEAKDAIKEVQDAGIQVVMITGDRLETAQAIAKEAGLLKEDSDLVMTSDKLNEMSDEAVKEILPRIRVIARALPTDKSRMVRLSQELNLVVGMTGDGVNDSPALKRADVGFAMGSGTEVAKEASKIIITDDNFKSIKDAIWYGRTIYNNILKFCKFQLTINVAAVIISSISVFFGIDEPLKVTHLLFVNLVMDSLGAIMLGNEPALEKYMKDKPRRRDESIVSKKMASQIGVASIWFVILSFIYLKLPYFYNMFETTCAVYVKDNADYIQSQHMTGYFVLFIACALFNGFNVRDDGFGIFKDMNKNKGFLRVILIIFLIQAFMVYSGYFGLSFIGEMFSCVSIGLKQYAISLLLGATMIPVDLIRKVVVKIVKGDF